MPRMRAVDAAVAVMAREGVAAAFGVPGAAINPLYSAMRQAGTIRHVLARHVEGASHMADGYSRAKPGNIGVCIGTSGPGGTDMIQNYQSRQARNHRPPRGRRPPPYWHVYGFGGHRTSCD